MIKWHKDRKDYDKEDPGKSIELDGVYFGARVRYDIRSVAMMSGKNITKSIKFHGECL